MDERVNEWVGGRATEPGLHRTGSLGELAKAAVSILLPSVPFLPLIQQLSMGLLLSVRCPPQALCEYSHGGNKSLNPVLLECIFQGQERDTEAVSG